MPSLRSRHRVNPCPQPRVHTWRPSLAFEPRAPASLPRSSLSLPLSLFCSPPLSRSPPPHSLARLAFPRSFTCPATSRASRPAIQSFIDEEEPEIDVDHGGRSLGDLVSKATVVEDGKVQVRLVLRMKHARFFSVNLAGQYSKSAVQRVADFVGLR